MIASQFKQTALVIALHVGEERPFHAMYNQAVLKINFIRTEIRDAAFVAGFDLCAGASHLIWHGESRAVNPHQLRRVAARVCINDRALRLFTERVNDLFSIFAEFK
jgi:hypothetical protein